MSRSMLGRISAVLGLALPIAAVTGGSASGESRSGESRSPGVVFTETNTSPNYIDVFSRGADGKLTPAGQVATGGNGRASNPPAGFPVIDAAGPVELSGDGDNRSCLFAVNPGSNTVSSFRVRHDGLELADQQATNGNRPISVTSTTRGDDKQLLYVLNSDTGSASIQGYFVSERCTLTPIPGSLRPTSSPDSLPAAIRFDEHGRVLAVSERFANGGNGEIDIFPVDRNGVTDPPVVNASAGRTPYGLDWSNRDILSVTNEDFPPPAVAGSTVTTYALDEDGTLAPLATAASPGAACWNLFTNNGKFLYTSNPGAPLFGGGAPFDAFPVDRNGGMTLVDQQNTNHNAIDNALSHDSKFLYVLSSQIIPSSPNSAINEFAIDDETGKLTPIGSIELPGNNTSGLAAW